MKLLALDISTNTGYAVFVDGQLQEHGTLWMKDKRGEFSASRYPFNLMRYARAISAEIYSIVRKFGPDEIVVEETTASKDNISQRILEFIHFGFLEFMCQTPEVPVAYIRDGVWKTATGSRQNAEERKWNANVKRIKAKTGAKLAKIDGKVVGRKTKKHYYIRSANDTFGLQMKTKDENEAAAILIGLAYTKGVPICDGTKYGGLFPKPIKEVV